MKQRKPHILLLQKVTLNTAQFLAVLEPLNYQCESNIDHEIPSCPGTAAIWRSNLPVTQVTSLVTCQLQSMKLNEQTIYNVYPPSGSNCRQDRAALCIQSIVHAVSNIHVLCNDYFLSRHVMTQLTLGPLDFKYPENILLKMYLSVPL